MAVGQPLEQRRLLDELRVHRSAAVLAVLSYLPESEFARKPNSVVWCPDRPHALGTRSDVTA